ncbi:MAG: UTP-glucose-1-phosphate uridylyltransferase [Streblomastix strix]|uniref:UTP--glucose-1-phosphate uridylyltransferase n=1 Tax=Streblomastix strix TaxID=222440 RepID=A0A5J4X1X6_9EUKA|nr:MAG: UTP-glucose-1-phosphate uridylyltransferase [Streblomastix strix]
MIEEALHKVLGDSQAKRQKDLIDRKDKCKIVWEKVKPLTKDQIIEYESLEVGEPSEIRNMLSKIAIVKLNGGLGTTMGLSGPKSTIVIRNRKNFLQLTFEQVMHINKQYQVNIPIVIMNSFYTEVQTQEFVKQFPKLNIICFNQNQFPRLNRETLLPIAQSRDAPDEYWYPPGHGDIYDCLHHYGTLDQLIGQGIEVLFLSNIDNLGATPDDRIMRQFLNPQKSKDANNTDILIELTSKLPVDVKGGTVINYPLSDGSNQMGFKLLEIAQVPADHIDEFKSVRVFSVFNTNNVWIRTGFLKKTLETENLKLDVIQNPKNIPGLPPILQLETACCAIVSCAKRIEIVHVHRLRFIPTKTCADLMLLMSDYYELLPYPNGEQQQDDKEQKEKDQTEAKQEPCFLHVSKKRNFHTTTPSISLGPFYSTITDLQKRCPHIPSLVDMEGLTVVGDVSFGSGVCIKGQVAVVAPTGQKLILPPGSVLDNVTVCGGLDITPR